MRTVRDADGKTYLLRKESSESALLYDPKSGTELYRPRSELELVSDESALTTAALAIPAPVRRILSATHNDRSIGLLVTVVDRGPIAAVDLVAVSDLCESDLLGLLSEFRAAGLVDETHVAGTRGYEATPLAVDGVNTLRSIESDRGESTTDRSAGTTAEE
ncbi:DUF7346 family protein [Halalkalirubrum salinum]|uniref:DUF7346 family protein n=1 Tax=Halalkalirubrum salinum TaxID=2563889 RepID=UPI0010FB3E8A|nr:hypothetical protein [Halalkalirubrum salinum]